MTKQLLVVENLDINFELHEKTVHAVRNVSFKVAEGETFGFWSANPVRASRYVHVHHASAA